MSGLIISTRYEGKAGDTPGENLEDVHDHAVEHMLVLGSQIVEAVEDNQLDIVVGLFDNEFGECRSSGCTH